MSINQKIPWKDEYNLGIKNIDTQHKKLFELVNRLYDLEDSKSSKEELRVILYEFSDYVKVHFKEEEEYMLSIGFPGLEEHKKKHMQIVDNLTQIITTPATLSIIKTKMRVVAKRALLDHITDVDIKIKEFLGKSDAEEIFDISDL